MITLKRNEEIECFQVELSLKVKTKQSPFISILILAKEIEEIDAISLNANLLSSFPERACSNLLKRLAEQKYLAEKRHGFFSSYTLTELGEECANDKFFWIGEKGVYNVYLSKSNFIKQQIIRTEKVERLEDDRKTYEIGTPNDIIQYQNRIISINKSEVLIEDVEKRCFQLKSLTGILEVQSKGNETQLKINFNNQSSYQTEIEIEENALRDELLSACQEFEYDKEKKAILSDFCNDNLSFNRRVRISKPIFQKNQFNQVELENIYHIPSDQQNADLWYWELLYRNMNDYFIDENSFNEYAREWSLLFQPHFKVKVPKRKELSALFSERKDAFYQIAKLETIDYLNY